METIESSPQEIRDQTTPDHRAPEVTVALNSPPLRQRSRYFVRSSVDVKMFIHVDSKSLVRKGVVDDCVADYGHVVVDECHHVSAHSFELILRRAKAKFVTGLSATVARKDGHHPIIFMQCGPVRHRVGAKQQAVARPFTHQVFVRPTSFRAEILPASNVDPRVEFHRLYGALRNDDVRNRMICADVLSAVREGRSPLVLTERVEHLEELAQGLSPDVANVILMRGGQSKRELNAALFRIANLPPSEARVILATGKFVGEGFDDPRLDTLFLALPISWRGTVAQHVGRLHRLHEDKREVGVYDYADLNVPMFSRMFDKRCREYESLGYTILLPASAFPGWPSEVSLPIDPEWKKDYAASVRRLIRDGVDVPLAPSSNRCQGTKDRTILGDIAGRRLARWRVCRTH